MNPIEEALSTQDIAHEQQSLLDLVDKLRSAQLENVKLPQIVVVGDQSAGKSSVLEALTGISFPRSATGCTRFATEIRLRRSPEKRFSIHIVPDKTRSFDEKERLRNFGKGVDPSMGFENLLALASHQIAPVNVPGSFAAKDVLVIEKAGPDMPLLTFVDLPGLVKNPNNEQSIEDIQAISDLADGYMKSSRTIILAVVGGNNDYVQAPILTKVRQFDPSGSRSIGVLTKPDLTKDIGLEERFIALVNNEDELNRFELGWYVLLNPGPRKPGEVWPSIEKRKQDEIVFFKTTRWNSVPVDRCGAQALKQQLSVQLQRHIGKHVRALQREIQKAYAECLAELKILGKGKDTVEEMREELVQLCSDSKDLIMPAVQGTYTNPTGKSFFPRSVDRKGTPPQNLRARCVAENRRFAQRVRTHGRKVHFASGPDIVPINGLMPGSTAKKDFARDFVEPLIQQNTGTEFPSDHNPRLVYTLFQDYSENWSNLAQLHKNNIGAICNEFLGEIVEYAWPQRMREPLRKQVLDPQVKQILEKAEAELTVLLQDLHFEIQPYDPEYNDRMQQWRSSASPENRHTAAEELLEKMLIYYELSARTFIHNVITQVIERHLLQGLLKIFSWVNINRLDEKTVLAIAAENRLTREKRVSLKARQASLEEARHICATLAMRKELRSFDDEDDFNTSDDSSTEAESQSFDSTQQRRRRSGRNDMQEVAPTPGRAQPRNMSQEQFATPLPTAEVFMNPGVNKDKGKVPASQFHFFDAELPSNSYKSHNNHLGTVNGQTMTGDQMPTMPPNAPPSPPKSDSGRPERKDRHFNQAQDANSFRTEHYEQYMEKPPARDPSSPMSQRTDPYPRLNSNTARTYVGSEGAAPAKPPKRFFG